MVPGKLPWYQENYHGTREIKMQLEEQMSLTLLFLEASLSCCLMDIAILCLMNDSLICSPLEPQCCLGK